MLRIHQRGEKKQELCLKGSRMFAQVVFELDLAGLIGTYLVKEEETKCKEKLVVSCD